MSNDGIIDVEVISYNDQNKVTKKQKACLFNKWEILQEAYFFFRYADELSGLVGVFTYLKKNVRLVCSFNFTGDSRSKL